MAKTIRWLVDPTVEEVSAVDLAANRKHFRLFKRGGTMKKGGAGGHARSVAKGDPDDFQPEWDAEEGVTLYPWGQAVADMSTAFSTDDGPRIAALLLAKYGEGPNAEIRLPSGIDPMEAATLAIEEGKGLMKDNPLLMPEAKGTKATKSAVRSVLAEFFGKKAVDVKKCGATATADSDLALQLKTLNGHLAALNATPAGTVTDAKAKGKISPVVEEEEDEAGIEVSDDGDGDDDGDEEEETENAGEDFAKAVKEDIGALVGAVKELAERMNAMESSVAKRSRGVSKAQHSGEAAGDKSGKPTTYYSTILGAEMPMDKVEPFLKRSAGKSGDAAVKH